MAAPTTIHAPIDPNQCAERERTWRSQSGQASPEWIGLIAVVAVLFVAILALAGLSFPGAALARSIAAKMICGVDHESSSCDGAGEVSDDELEAAWSPEIAQALHENLPEIRYEFGKVDIPVDFRECRTRDCAASETAGEITESIAGMKPTTFVHVVDCRDPEAPIPSDADCGGDASGSLYLQYWLYYPNSYAEPLGSIGYHDDDWESYQVRIASDGSTQSRASSHHSYWAGDGLSNPLGVRGWASDLGIDEVDGWHDSERLVWVSENSHAGRTESDDYFAFTPYSAVEMIPIDPNVDAFDLYEFEKPGGWRKHAFRSPEAEDTGGDTDPATVGG